MDGIMRFAAAWTRPLAALVGITAGSLHFYTAEAQDGVVIIGNSMVGEGIDRGLITQLSGTRCSVIRRNSAMSAWQYLQLKTRVSGVKLALVVVREMFVTAPHVRAKVNFGDDPVIDQVLTPWKSKMTDNWGPTVSKAELWVFPNMVESSFLPHMIQVARDKNFTLVIARHKSRRYCRNLIEKPYEQKYRHDLATYLAGKGMIFLDYTVDRQIQESHYGNGDHLNRGEGRKLWSTLVAEDIKAILAGKKAPRQLTGAAGSGLAGAGAGTCKVTRVSSAYFCGSCKRILETAERGYCRTCNDGKISTGRTRADRVSVCLKYSYRCEADSVKSLKGGACKKCRKFMKRVASRAQVVYRCTGCGKEGKRTGRCPEPECKKGGKKIVKACTGKEFPHVAKAKE